MRRATPVLLLAMLLVLSASAARAQGQASFNGIGLIDYSTKPTFKVGDWARYRMKGSSEMGMSDDYTLTVLIAGEEDFWGDPGFWVETWLDVPGQPARTQASLVSYTIFADTSAIQRLLLYTRKMITMLNDDGTPKIDINRPTTGTLKARHDVKNPVSWSRDTLGRDTVSAGGKTYAATKVLMRQGKAVTQAAGDSTIYTELREDRTSWYAREVPITHLVREDIETTSSRKTWMIGRSGDATPLNIRDRGTGTALLLDYGSSGKTARLLPERYRKSIAAQNAAYKAATSKSSSGKSATSASAGKR